MQISQSSIQKKYLFINWISDVKFIFFFILILKIFLLATFSSDYKDALFVPFVKHFLQNFDNTWQYFYTHKVGVEFPYHPLMLYILSVFGSITLLFNSNGFHILENFIFKLPILFFDFLICFLLFKIFPHQKKKVLLFYFLSPIILYSSYIHSQIDIIPTAIIFLSIYYLRNKKIVESSVFAGLALCTKFHVLAAFPLIIVYILKNFKLKQLFLFFAISASIYFLISMPYLYSKGFYYLVLANPKQAMFLEMFFKINNLKIYLTLFVLMGVYLRFFLYEKINKDLFDSFLGIVFILLIIFTSPSPGWYIWAIPFFSVFLIKFSEQRKEIISIYIFLNIFYIAYFAFFYLPELHDIKFLGANVDFKIHIELLKNIIFDTLLVLLCSSLLFLYKLGIKSNFMYKDFKSFVIGISGDSGAGKTTLLNGLKSLLGNDILELEGDGYHKWERNSDEWETITHLNPKANYLHKQVNDLFLLKKGKTISNYEYDHDTGKFKYIEKVSSKKFIIICGLHSFFLPKMRKLIDLKIFMDTDENLRKIWKLKRDTAERSQSEENALAKINVRLVDSEKYIIKQKEFADINVKYFIKDENIESFGNDNIGVQISLDASVNMESLIQELINSQVSFDWDYSDDMKSQYITIYDDIQSDIIMNIAKKAIVNLEELIYINKANVNPFSNITQLIIIKVLSEKLSEIS